MDELSVALESCCEGANILLEAACLDFIVWWPKNLGAYFLLGRLGSMLCYFFGIRTSVDLSYQILGSTRQMLALDSSLDSWIREGEEP
jgi:hypothetical protein